MTDANFWARRAFLKRAAIAGSAAALFPWLNHAKAAVAPKRLLLVYTPHGTVWNSWRPGGGETDFTFSPILNPLAAHRSKLLIVDGLKMVTGTQYYIPHTYTMPVLWTGSPIDTNSTLFRREDHMQSFGWNTGVSIDQAIASQIAGTEPYGTLELGHDTRGLHPANRMIYSGPSQPKNPLDGPAATFSALFGALDPNLAQAAKDARRRKSVLDTVIADFASRKGKLSAADKARLDAHADSLREVEKVLTADAVTCEKPATPTGVNSQTAMDKQSDLLVQALACGFTRVASFQMHVADNDTTLYPWLGIDSGHHHSLSHDNSPATQAKLAGLYTWYSGRIAHLLDKLATTDDVDGTKLLDNTLVVWASELGQAWNHNIDNIPVVMAGGAGVGLRGGRYLKVTNMRFNRALITAFHAMGLTNVNTYGTLDNGSGPIPGALT
jgi:hypothetical protein